MQVSRTPKGALAQAATQRLGAAISREGSLPERLLLGLTRFQGKVMLVLSGRDLIAREFDDLINSNEAWQEQLRRKPTTRHDLPESDHTFSSAVQRNQVVVWGLNWLRSW